MDHRSTIVDAVLPNGAAVKIVALDEGGAQDVGLREALSFDAIQDVLTGVAEMVRNAVDASMPDTVEVEFALGASLDAGKLVALLTNLTGQASFTIRLNWNCSDRAGTGSTASQ